MVAESDAQAKAYYERMNIVSAWCSLHAKESAENPRRAEKEVFKNATDTRETSPIRGDPLA